MIIQLFGKAIYSAKLDIDTKKIVSEIDCARKSGFNPDENFLEDKNPHKIKFSEEGAKNPNPHLGELRPFMLGSAKESLYVLEQKRFKFLKDIVLRAFDSYAYDGMRYKNKFKITTSWFTEFEPGEEGQMHRHGNCCISGILYLQTAPNSGDIIFHDFNERRYDLISSEWNHLNSKSWKWTPEDGVIIFFPGELHHRVEKNLSKIKRHSLAFNLIPVGTIGDETGDSHIYLEYG